MTTRSGHAVKWLGRMDYQTAWHAMRQFTETRGAQTGDEIWLLEHPPVFTLGIAARREHLLEPGDIPVVQTERGGQVTYHGPGQLIVYPLLDLRRLQLNVRQYVSLLEQSVIRYVAQLGIRANNRSNAPGVYVGERKLASLGIRVRRGATYHGLALNVDMDLTPFTRINPCGYAGLEMTRLVDLGVNQSLAQVAVGYQQQLLGVLKAHE
jgi:lipoyl(octanoyl) transferase